MSETFRVDVCVIGGGSGGLGLAAGAVQMGARVALIEKGKMGGDCLNYGCVPSKALLAAGKQAQNMRQGEAFGITPVEPQIDFGKVHDHVHAVINTIAPHDSVERFEGLGVKVFQGMGGGRFLDRRTVAVGDHTITARRIVIATGSSAAIPEIPGIEGVPFLTNETIFDQKTCPEHLIIIGGGPIGMEMAQAHRRLGARVTVLEAFQPFGKDDPELAAIVMDKLRREGVTIRTSTRIVRVEKTDRGLVVHIGTEKGEETLEGSHLLVAAGRKPNVEGLDLEKAGIAYGRGGIVVDARLRTTNRKVYAIGDVTGGLQFTHVAGYHAGIAIRNILFRMPAKADHSSIPRVTYTDPELAHVGETEAQARDKYGKVEILRWTFAENDRAQAERNTQGVVKVVTDTHGRILGVSIVGPHAGELIQPWVLAKSGGQKISALASMVAPYPTLTETSKRAAGSYYTPTLYGEKTRFLVRFLGLFG